MDYQYNVLFIVFVADAGVCMRSLHVLEWRDEDIAQRDDLYFAPSAHPFVHRLSARRCVCTHILMLQMLQQLQFTICSFRQDWRAERLHDLLDRHILSCKLIFGRTRSRLRSQPNVCVSVSLGSRLCVDCYREERLMNDVVVKRTRRDRKLPCQQVVNPSI